MKITHVLVAALLCPTATHAEQKFQRIKGARIQAAFAGMEMTDEVHWGDVFERNGTVVTYSMGHKSAGKWRVQKDELCIDRGGESAGCYQVWMSGKKVELRREGSSLPLEGIMTTPQQRR